MSHMRSAGQIHQSSSYTAGGQEGLEPREETETRQESDHSKNETTTILDEEERRSTPQKKKQNETRG